MKKNPVSKLRAERAAKKAEERKRRRAALLESRARFSRFLTAQLASKNISQEELALFLGIEQQAVSAWTRGVCLPAVQYLPRLAQFFDVPVSELTETL